MSAATQILFNSPALHSLKRDQLVKLCKIHSLKANGKNKDLIERLQEHAKYLPPDDPLSVATRSDNFEAKIALDSEGDESEAALDIIRSSSNPLLSRPSEQWEVVMDSIAEVDEETLRSNRALNVNLQAGEFGSRGTKASSLTSLKAIATSLGLKRNNSQLDVAASSSMSKTETVFSTLTTSDHERNVEHPPVEPIPGQTNLQGMPAPAHARLSITQAPTTTTIRLVAGGATSRDILSPPRLKPFATTFDLIPGTPTGGEEPMWPLSPPGAQIQSLYPSLTSFQESAGLCKSATPQSHGHDCSDMEIDMPGGMGTPLCIEPTPKKVNDSTGRVNTGATPRSVEKPSVEPIDIFSPAPKPQKASTRSRIGIPRSEPFIFGSPLPQHNNLSNQQFRSATQSVLEEMNKRLAEDGIKGIDMDILRNQQRLSTREPDGENQVAERDTAVHAMFEKAHQGEFNKMESIVDYAQKRVKVEPIISKKRKSSLMVKDKRSSDLTGRRRPSGLRVASGASRTKVLSGSFGDEDEEADIGERRASKRPRLECETLAEEAKQAPQDKETSATVHAGDVAGERGQKEREAIRRRLEHNRAKRRSSMGRPSLVGRAPPPQKPKASRFGFLSTAKSIVQSVWNRGAGSSAPPHIPKTAVRKETKVSTTVQSKKVAVVPGSSGPPPLGNDSHLKRGPSGGTASGRPATQCTASKSTIAPPMLSIDYNGTVSSHTSRAQLPSPGVLTATGSKASITADRGNHSKNNSVTCMSSFGMRGGVPGTTSQVSSIGMRTSNQGSGASAQAKPAGSLVRSRTSSTLMAPTVSSLAKTNSLPRIPATSRNENTGSIRAAAGTLLSKMQEDASPRPAPSSTALGQITNSPNRPPSPCLPADKISGQPSSPTMVHPQMSLTAAAQSLLPATGATSSSKPPLPPKPKVMPGRKPRISRSKVIARLVSQRAAEAGSMVAPGMGVPRGKTRSSAGADVAGRRRAHSGRRSGSAEMQMAAKRRARQSEYARRRSRAVTGEAAGQMDVDSKVV